jgi:hypothetical protein
LQISSLALSAALLRAILVNHFAHSEVTKMATGKTVEANLKGKLDDMDLTALKLEAELKQYVHSTIVSFPFHLIFFSL